MGACSAPSGATVPARIGPPPPAMVACPNPFVVPDVRHAGGSAAVAACPARGWFHVERARLLCTRWGDAQQIHVERGSLLCTLLGDSDLSDEGTRIGEAEPAGFTWNERPDTSNPTVQSSPQGLSTGDP
jgi:hypothetical protein